MIALSYIVFVLFYCTVTCWRNGQDSTFIAFYTWNFHLVALKIHRDWGSVVSVWSFPCCYLKTKYGAGTQNSYFFTTKVDTCCSFLVLIVHFGFFYLDVWAVLVERESDCSTLQVMSLLMLVGVCRLLVLLHHAFSFLELFLSKRGLWNIVLYHQFSLPMCSGHSHS